MTFKKKSRQHGTLKTMYSTLIVCNNTFVYNKNNFVIRTYKLIFFPVCIQYQYFFWVFCDVVKAIVHCKIQQYFAFIVNFCRKKSSIHILAFIPTGAKCKIVTIFKILFINFWQLKAPQKHFIFTFLVHSMVKSCQEKKAGTVVLGTDLGSMYQTLYLFFKKQFDNL